MEYTSNYTCAPRTKDKYDKPIIIRLNLPIDLSYNKLVGGSKNSLHLEFNAIDFTVKDKEYLRNLFLQLDIWDKEYHFKFLPKAGSMGIGFYENRFIHLDRRGTFEESQSREMVKLS